MPLFLIYFILLTNLYSAETLNIVLSFIIDVHFVMVLLLFPPPKMWRFLYPFRFCNPVRIYGRKIDDDDIPDDGMSSLSVLTSYESCVNWNIYPSFCITHNLISYIKR